MDSCEESSILSKVNMNKQEKERKTNEQHTHTKPYTVKPLYSEH